MMKLPNIGDTYKGGEVVAVRPAGTRTVETTGEACEVVATVEQEYPAVVTVKMPDGERVRLTL